MKKVITLACGIITASLIGSWACTAMAECNYMEKKYMERAVTCQTGHKYACEDGSWIDAGAECPDSNAVQSYDASACSCTNANEQNCNSLGKLCASAQDSGRCIITCTE